jgi:diguanylate cyclase (GGDEF)-like protein
MEKPATPIDETQRLRTLHALKLLDTAEEERFDRITRLAVRLFDAPITLVSLVAQDRQWFKSRQGLDACETGRDISFCGHAILHESALVVPDALQDPRFADNPLVTGPPHIRFYAGHPVCAADGSRVGTVCIIDRKPREFSQADTATLADLAGMVSRELSLSQLATVDELTQLCNRRGFLAAAQKCLAHCKRAAQPATLAIIDLDGFKAINDTHGHAAGDQVLREFSALLLKHFRLSDVVARLSGDEFCVLASGATEESLATAFARFTDSYSSSRLARTYPHLTWSVGVAEFQASSNEPLNRLLQIADLRMYEAKSQQAAG